MERLQQQMAQMQSMMDSMSPEMRQELEDAMGSALDPETLQAMNELASMMEVMMPMDELPPPVSLPGRRQFDHGPGHGPDAPTAGERPA